MATAIHLNPYQRHFWFALASLVLSIAFFWAGEVQAQSTILDNIGNTYRTAAQGWGDTLFSIAQGLFIKLALLEILWFGLMFVIEKDDPRQFMVMLLKKIMALLFFYAILLNFDVWIPAVIDGFTQAGADAGGVSVLTPSAVVERGMALSTAIFDKTDDLGISEVGTAFVIGLVALMVLFAFIIIAGQLLVTLIESYLVVTAGVLFLGFAGSRWTTTFAEKYISYAVSVGVKLFITYLIIGAGQTLSDSWMGILQSSNEASAYLEVLAGAVVYTFLAFQIPSLASSILTGSVSMTLGGLAATAGTLGAAAAGAAGVAASTVAGAAGGAAGLAKTLGAAVNAAKAGGATGLGGVAAGAVGALGAAAGGAISDGIKGLGGAGETKGLAGRLNDKAASLNEAKAASGVSAPSVPGASPASSAPDSSSANASAPSAEASPSASEKGSESATESKTESGTESAGKDAAPSATESAPAPAESAPAEASGSPTSGGESNVAPPAAAPIEASGASSKAEPSPNPSTSNSSASSAAAGAAGVAASTASTASTAGTQSAGNSGGTESTPSSASPSSAPSSSAPAATPSSEPSSLASEAGSTGTSSSSSESAESASGPVDAPSVETGVSETASESSAATESGSTGTTESVSSETPSAPEAPAPSATSAEAPAQAPVATPVPSSAGPAAAQPATASAPTAPTTPQRPTPPAPAPQGNKPSFSQRIQESAKGMGELPNDAAPGASIQINLKAD